MERMSYKNENENVNYLMFDNFPQSSTFCEIFTSKFCSVYLDCQRLQEIVKDSAHTFRKLSKIDLPIVKDSRSRNSFSSFNPPHNKCFFST